MSENQEAMDEINNQIDELISAANDLKNNGYNLLDQATGSASAGVLQAQKKAANHLAALAEDKSQLRGEDAEGWQGFKDDFHNFFVNMRVEHNENEIEKDLKKAESMAERAEDNAINSLTYALDSLQSAQVAVLDAVQARAYQMELEADLKG